MNVEREVFIKVNCDWRCWQLGIGLGKRLLADWLLKVIAWTLIRLFEGIKGSRKVGEAFKGSKEI